MSGAILALAVLFLVVAVVHFPSWQEGELPEVTAAGKDTLVGFGTGEGHCGVGKEAVGGARVDPKVGCKVRVHCGWRLISLLAFGWGGGPGGFVGLYGGSGWPGKPNHWCPRVRRCWGRAGRAGHGC